MNYSYVDKADLDKVKVYADDKDVSNKLIQLGFKKIDKNQFEINASNNLEKANIFEKLRAIGVLFSDGKEWCPSEVFEHLRDLGLINGKFKRISWKGGKDTNIQEI
ncbi:hypothetical protein L1F30_11835 [Simiduia sp. 21SJ11W-1]|uniref:hypothetical protein n=1 Tax=Simiduia sp. 21SJ11W-1 TaxID=2909669 RepID=UPI0020A081B9|nr:hypothetical protein [Simiduia sp. 21SJ11W-1]UTA46851.1 hypothetical protein L1F30_11835 [Simiduia sp. 21SJ11W-1]